MGELFIYMVKVAVYLAGFYIVYSVLLSQDTTYRRNRLFILISFFSALTFPLITFHSLDPLNTQFSKLLSEVFVSASGNTAGSINKIPPLSVLFKNICSIYFIVVLIFLSKLLIDFLNLLFLVIRHKKEGSRIIRFHGFSTSGFSAMGYIFINIRLSSDEAGYIINHERNHLKQNHFIDIIIVEIIKAFQWFNPFVYLFNKSLRAIHEYQADKQCLTSGIPIVNYQCLLLNQVFRSGSFNLTNSFSNPSLIKKRMIMMTKEQTSSIANIKMLLAIPVIVVVFFILSSFRDAESSLLKLEPYVVVDEMPIYQGGDQALLGYIAQNTKYPEHAAINGIQGKVIIKFCITAKGQITLVSVLQGVNTELDNEAVRVVKTLSAFTPGKLHGKPVPVWYMVPINFTLK